MTADIGGFNPTQPKNPKVDNAPGLAAIKGFMNMHNIPQAAPLDNPTAPMAQPDQAVPMVPFTPPAKASHPDETAFEAAIAAAEKSPELTYEDRVKAQGLTMTEATGIVDSMITRGLYEKTVPVTSRFNVTFRTRSVEDNDKMFEKLEKNKPEFNLSITGHIAKYNLIHSLSAFGPTKFENNAEGKEKAAKFVAALPGPMFALLVNKLAKFDTQINVVLDDGAIENF